MTINAQAFKDARNRLGLSQAELAQRAGTSQTTIDKIESGQTKNSRFIAALAQALEVPLADLDPAFALAAKIEGMTSTINAASQALLDKLPPEKRREIERSEAQYAAANPPEYGDVPVYPAVEGGSGALIIDTDPIEFVARPEPLAGVKDGYLAYIAGDSMVPAYRPGEKAIVHPKLPPVPDEAYIFYTNNAADDRAMIKFLWKITAEDWHVEQYNPPKRFTLDRSEWPICHRVVGKYSRT